MAVLVMEPGWPGPHRGVTPGVVGQKDDPAGTHPVAQQVVEGEVLQLVGADLRLGGLDLLPGASRDELGGDFRPQNGLQDDIGGFVELARRNAPPDEMLDEGLRHAGVDPVVAHLVADAEGAPPQG